MQARQPQVRRRRGPWMIIQAPWVIILCMIIHDHPWDRGGWYPAVDLRM